MAKQLVGPIERHIEKVVIGIVGLGLLATIALFLATSPNRIDVDGEMVGPGQIADKVLDKADVIRGRIRNANPDEEDFEPLYDQFAENLDSINNAGVKLASRVAVAVPPDVPIVDKAEKTTQDRKLVEVNGLGDALATSGRSTFLIEEDSTRGERTISTAWATVTATFNVREQTEKQSLEYGVKRSEVVFLPPDVQRRRQRTDGSWSDEDWESLDPWPAEDLPPAPVVELSMGESGPEASEAVFARIDRFYKTISEPSMQLSIVRPMPATWISGDKWTIPVVSSRRDVLLMDQEFLYPNPADRPEQPEDIRYGGSDKPVVPGATEDQDAPKMLLLQSREFLTRARDNCSLQDSIKAYNRALDVTTDKNARRSEQAQAKRLIKEAQEAEADIRLGTCRPKQAPVVVEGEVKKERFPTQQFWAHDARPGSIRNGATYQYRMQPVVFNRLAAQPQLFGDPEAAETVLLYGPWSNPTTPVTFEPDMFHYTISNDKRDNEVTVELFRWFKGYWVKTRKSFTVGERVAATDRCDIPLPDDPTVIMNPKIPFDTGMTVIDIDHERAHRARKKGRKGSVGFEQPGEVCSVVFMDEEGRLHERFVPTDKTDPGKSLVGGRVFKAPRGSN